MANPTEIPEIAGDPLTDRRPKKTRRRWFQFSLRVFLLVLIAGCVWLGYVANRAQRQRAAVAKIEAAHGAVLYDDEKVLDDDSIPMQIFSATIVRRTETTPERTWLRKVVGDDYFRSVIGVWLGRPPEIAFKRVGDDDVLALREFLQLKYLDLSNSSITDQTLIEIGRLKSLQYVDLGQTPITDAGVASLADLIELEHLDLEQTAVTDEGLASLVRLRKLKFLDLGRTKISDDGLQRLKSLTQLKTLWVSDKQISSAGLAKLQAMLPNAKLRYSESKGRLYQKGWNE